MKAFLIRTIVLIMVINMLTACNKQADASLVAPQSPDNQSTNIVKESETVKFNITKDIPKDFESTILGGLSAGGCFIQTVRRGFDTDLVIVYFKQWKPYDRLDVINDGSTIKIRYEEKASGEAERVMLSFNLKNEGKNKTIELYRNGALVTENVKFGYGIE